MRETLLFITEDAVVDRIIDHLKLVFVAEKPPPPDRLSRVVDGRRVFGRISFMILSKSSGEVRVMSGSSGSADGFRVVRPRSPGALDVTEP